MAKSTVESLNHLFVILSSHLREVSCWDPALSQYADSIKRVQAELGNAVRTKNKMAITEIEVRVEAIIEESNTHIQVLKKADSLQLIQHNLDSMKEIITHIREAVPLSAYAKTAYLNSYKLLCKSLKEIEADISDNNIGGLQTHLHHFKVDIATKFDPFFRFARLSTADRPLLGSSCAGLAEISFKLIDQGSQFLSIPPELSMLYSSFDELKNGPKDVPFKSNKKPPPDFFRAHIDDNLSSRSVPAIANSPKKMRSPSKVGQISTSRRLSLTAATANSKSKPGVRSLNDSSSVRNSTNNRPKTPNSHSPNKITKTATSNVQKANINFRARLSDPNSNHVHSNPNNTMQKRQSFPAVNRFQNPPIVPKKKLQTQKSVDEIKPIPQKAQIPLSKAKSNAVLAKKPTYPKSASEQITKSHLASKPSLSKENPLKSAQKTTPPKRTSSGIPSAKQPLSSPPKRVVSKSTAQTPPKGAMSSSFSKTTSLTPPTLPKSPPKQQNSDSGIVLKEEKKVEKSLLETHQLLSSPNKNPTQTSRLLANSSISSSSPNTPNISHIPNISSISRNSDLTSNLSPNSNPNWNLSSSTNQENLGGIGQKGHVLHSHSRSGGIAPDDLPIPANQKRILPGLATFPSVSPKLPDVVWELGRLGQSMAQDEQLYAAIKSAILGNSRGFEDLIQSRISLADQDLHQNLHSIRSRLVSLNSNFLKQTEKKGKNPRNTKTEKLEKTENSEAEENDFVLEGMKKRMERMIKTNAPPLQFFTNESARLRGLQEPMNKFMGPPKGQLESAATLNEKLVAEMKLSRERLTIMNDITEAADVSGVEVEILREMCREEAAILGVEDPLITTDQFDSPVEKLARIEIDDTSVFALDADDEENGHDENDSENDNENENENENENNSNNEKVHCQNDNEADKTLHQSQKIMLEKAKSEFQKVATYQNRIELMREAIEKAGKTKQNIPIDQTKIPREKIDAKILELIQRQQIIFDTLAAELSLS